MTIPPIQAERLLTRLPGDVFDPRHWPQTDGSNSARLAHAGVRMGQDRLELAGGDLFRPRKIKDLAVLFQVVESSLPVIAHYEAGYPVSLDVTGLLCPGCFRHHSIDIANRLDDLDAIFERDRRPLPLDRVELVRRNAYDQPISQCTCASELIHMSDMEQIERSVGEYDSHVQNRGRSRVMGAARHPFVSLNTADGVASATLALDSFMPVSFFNLQGHTAVKGGSPEPAREVPQPSGWRRKGL